MEFIKHSPFSFLLTGKIFSFSGGAGKKKNTKKRTKKVRKNNSRKTVTKTKRKNLSRKKATRKKIISKKRSINKRTRSKTLKKLPKIYSKLIQKYSLGGPRSQLPGSSSRFREPMGTTNSDTT